MPAWVHVYTRSEAQVPSRLYLCAELIDQTSAAEGRSERQRKRDRRGIAASTLAARATAAPYAQFLGPGARRQPISHRA